MDLTKISPELSTSPQINAADLIELKSLGFRSVICNRPDDEDQAQPRYAQIAAAAREAGLEARHIPVSGGAYPDAEIAAFGAALSQLPTPILAYCQTGTRSATLWRLATESQQTT